MTPIVTPSSAPLAILAAHGIVSVLVVPEPPTVECPECDGSGQADGVVTSGRDPRKRFAIDCPSCGGSGRVPVFSGRHQSREGGGGRDEIGLGPTHPLHSRIVSGRVDIATPETPPKDREKCGPWTVYNDSVLVEMTRPNGGRFDVLPIPEPGSVVASCTIECVPIVDAADAAFGQGRAACDQCVVVGDDFLDICTLGDEHQPAQPPNVVRLDAPDLSDAYLISDILDQLAYQEFVPGAWALLLGDVKRVERCPECWGTDEVMVGEEPGWCERCNGSGGVDPYPVPDDAEVVRP